MLVSACSAVAGFTLVYWVDDCRPLVINNATAPIQVRIHNSTKDAFVAPQMWCKDGEYSAVGHLFLRAPEAGVKVLFHDPIGKRILVDFHLISSLSRHFQRRHITRLFYRLLVSYHVDIWRFCTEWTFHPNTAHWSRVGQTCRHTHELHLPGCGWHFLALEYLVIVNAGDRYQSRSLRIGRCCSSTWRRSAHDNLIVHDHYGRFVFSCFS